MICWNPNCCETVRIFLCLYGCKGYVRANYKPRRGRLRGSRGSPSIWNVYELRQEHSRAQTGAFTGSIWNILGANRQVFTPLHSNVSSWVRAVFNWYQNRNMFTNYKPRRGILGPLDKYLLHCIRMVRTLRVTSTGIKYHIKEAIPLNGF